MPTATRTNSNNGVTLIIQARNRFGLQPIADGAGAPARRALTNNLPLFARRDFPRRHAELIDVPIPDGHLDRGYHCLIAVASL
jgi:hypothetical protein